MPLRNSTDLYTYMSMLAAHNALFLVYVALFAVGGFLALAWIGRVVPEKSSYQTLPFPKMRRLAGDLGWLVRNRYMMRGALEIDVTRPRQLIREHKTGTGETISFTAYLTKCVAQAVELDKNVHAMRNWRGDLVIFEDVDVGALIEREAGGKKYPLAHIVRAANQKSLRAIHDEIRRVQAQPTSDREASSLNALVKLPKFARRSLLWVVSKSPHMRKQNMGTVSLSAVGMFGSKTGWGMVPNFHSLSLIVGSIAQKPGVVEGRIEIREYLCLTIDFDHEVIDGAPAARFAKQLSELIESGFGLLQPD